MKSIIYLLGLIAASQAAPVIEGNKESGLVRAESVINPDGSYQYGYETRDGSTRVEIGEQREIAGERGTVSRGTYSYIVDGVNYVVVYSADENGFVATGAHLPKPVEPLPVETLPVVPVETMPAETVPVETVPTVILPVEPIVPLQVPDVVLTLPAVGSATTL